MVCLGMLAAGEAERGFLENAASSQQQTEREAASGGEMEMSRSGCGISGLDVTSSKITAHGLQIPAAGALKPACVSRLQRVREADGAGCARLPRLCWHRGSSLR
nr:uncharacterized protein LOC125179916 isoform X2 [Anser cygnoides]